jgi:hypothetical protein
LILSFEFRSEVDLVARKLEREMDKNINMYSIKRELENYAKSKDFGAFQEKIERLIDEKIRDISRPLQKVGEPLNLDKMTETIQKKLDFKADEKDLNGLKSSFEHKISKIIKSIQATKNNSQSLFLKNNLLVEKVDLLETKLSSLQTSSPTDSGVTFQLSTLKSQLESLKSSFDQNRAEVHLQLHSLKTASPIPPPKVTTPAPPPTDPSLLTKLTTLSNSLSSHIASTFTELEILRSRVFGIILGEISGIKVPKVISIKKPVENVKKLVRLEQQLLWLRQDQKSIRADRKKSFEIIFEAITDYRKSKAHMLNSIKKLYEEIKRLERGRMGVTLDVEGSEVQGYKKELSRLINEWKEIKVDLEGKGSEGDVLLKGNRGSRNISSAHPGSINSKSMERGWVLNKFESMKDSFDKVWELSNDP